MQTLRGFYGWSVSPASIVWGLRFAGGMLAGIGQPRIVPPP
jgi:hypothetical protein